MKVAWGFLFSLLTIPPAFSAEIEKTLISTFPKPGFYVVEGRLEKTSKLILRQGASSEVQITLEGKINPSAHEHLGTNVRACIQIDEPCFLACRARLIKILRKIPRLTALDPMVGMPLTRPQCRR